MNCFRLTFQNNTQLSELIAIFNEGLPMDLPKQYKSCESITIFNELLPMDLPEQHNHANLLLLSTNCFHWTFRNNTQSCTFLAIFNELLPVDFSKQHTIMQIHSYSQRIASAGPSGTTHNHANPLQFSTNRLRLCMCIASGPLASSSPVQIHVCFAVDHPTSCKPL